MYNIIYGTSRQSRFDARYWMLGLVHWDDPEGWCGQGGGRRGKLRQLLDEGTLRPDQALVGFVGANASAEVISGYTAFLLGIRSVAPEAVMRVRYTGSWGNYTAEKEATRRLIEEGCVIIAQHVNTSASAAACEEAVAAGRQVYHVGYHQSMMDI